MPKQQKYRNLGIGTNAYGNRSYGPDWKGYKALPKSVAAAAYGKAQTLPRGVSPSAYAFNKMQEQKKLAGEWYDRSPQGILGAAYKSGALPYENYLTQMGVASAGHKFDPQNFSDTLAHHGYNVDPSYLLQGPRGAYTKTAPPRYSGAAPYYDPATATWKKNVQDTSLRPHDFDPVTGEPASVADLLAYNTDWTVEDAQKYRTGLNNQKVESARPVAQMGGIGGAGEPFVPVSALGNIQGYLNQYQPAKTGMVGGGAEFANAAPAPSPAPVPAPTPLRPQPIRQERDPMGSLYDAFKRSLNQATMPPMFRATWS